MFKEINKKGRRSNKVTREIKADRKRIEPN